jgi:hypothetical protein
MATARNRGRQVRVELEQRRRHGDQDVADHLQLVVPVEGRSAGEQFVQQRADRVQVRPAVHRPGGPAGLLRRQVGQRPGQPPPPGRPGLVLLGAGGQVEVDQYRLVPLADQHQVRRVDVPVDHPAPVHRRHGRGQPVRQ